MLKAYEVMTHPLATCAPEASVTDVAATMRDRDIGDVLIVEDGKLHGIVTDRDLALQALTGQDDPTADAHPQVYEHQSRDGRTRVGPRAGELA